MSFWEEEHERSALAEALGSENVAGFHVEIFYQTSPFWEVSRRGDGTQFPCIDDQNVYSGCLGSACEAKTCWAGDLVAGARNAPVQRSPLPRVERQGARCHLCAEAQDTDEGKVDCAKGHFERPITPACLIRRRVPETAPIPCPDFAKRKELRSDVAAYRRVRRARTQAGREAAAVAEDEQRQAS